MEMNHVLIVEDDKEIREGVEIYLKSQGYVVFQAADGVEGLEVIEKEEIHLAIVDVMMPRMDGIQMTVKLREKYDFPVIFLSAKSEEVDKIMGLNMGADDYVTKPFSPKEVAFRVKAQLRRAEYRQIPERPHAITIGELVIDPDGCRASKNGKDLELTAREFEILYYLAQNMGRVISRERLYETVWGEDSFGCDNTMMVHIRHLREKIEDNPATPKYIITMKGLGYKLVNPYER